VLKYWKLKKTDPALARKLSHEASLSPLLAQLLINRSIIDARSAFSFLSPQLKELHEPLGLKDMDRAIERIKKALRDGERILIFGDYDVDGLTSTALLMSALKGFGADAHTYIPDRIREGYGLNENAIDAARKVGATLLIAVDCGTNAHSVISKLRECAIDVIVIDHHEPSSDKSPDAILINPLRGGCTYPYKHLAGVGLAYKVLMALDEEFSVDSKECLDLVALGTICDVVPMIAENRILAKEGLGVLRRTKKPGLLAIIDEARITPERLTAYHAGYVIGPRLNAQGRLHTAQRSLQILLTNSKAEAKELASTLSIDNTERQKTQAQVLKQALDKISGEVNFAEDRAIVLYDEKWHPGVIGIVASKIVDRFYRPCILIAGNGPACRGSGRSIPNFNLVKALEHCKEHLLGYGGHKSACGLTIAPANLDSFKRALNEFANRDLLPSDLIPTIEVDADFPICDLGPELAGELDRLSPFGHGNSRPLLLSRNLKLKSRPVLSGKKRVSFWVTDGKKTFEAVTFDSDLSADAMASDTFDIVYSPTLDSWHGRDFVRLELKDLRPTTMD